MKIYENNPNHKFHENINDKLENKLCRYQSKPNYFDSSSSENSSEFNNIQYYENFLKSLKKENISKTPNFSPIILYKRTPKKKNYKEFRKRLKKRNSKGNILNDKHIPLFNSNDDTNNENYFFQMKSKSMSKYANINKLNVEESPKKNFDESINAKNGHNKYILNYLSNNQINEVDELKNTPEFAKVKNEIIKVSSPKKHFHFFDDKNNNKEVNNNQKKYFHNYQEDYFKNKQLKLNLKNIEIKKCNTLNPILKETDEKINIKVENNTSRNKDNHIYSIPIKKKKLFCFCIPFS